MPLDLPTSFGRPAPDEEPIPEAKTAEIHIPVVLVPGLDPQVLAELADGVRAAVAAAVAQGLAEGVAAGLAEIGVAAAEFGQEDQTLPA